MDFLNQIHWRNGQPINLKERNMIIYLSGCGMNSTEIAGALSRNKSTIDKWLNRFETTGEMNVLRHTGRPRGTTQEEDYMINLHAIDNPKIKLREIKDICGLNCNRMTISRRLTKNKLYCRVARIKEHLSAGHRAMRLQFAQENLNFPHWDRTIFVDEATFMTGTAHRQLIRRPIGE